MKKFFIILSIFSVSFLFCLIGYSFYLKPLYAEKYANKVPFELNRKVSFLACEGLEKLLPDQTMNNESQIDEQEYQIFLYREYLIRLSESNLELDVAKERLSSYIACQKELFGTKPKTEILLIKRTASLYVMNNPAYYNRDIVNNKITEKGQGADNENIYVLYLSDGTIIKASPRNKPQWLGTKVGEKVRKTTAKEAVLHGNTYKVETVVKYSPLYE